jgi:integrase
MKDSVRRSRRMAHSATKFGIGATKLYHCSAHGLRKAGATIAANNGATAHQLMAIFGWDTIKEAELDGKKNSNCFCGAGQKPRRARVK